MAQELLKPSLQVLRRAVYPQPSRHEPQPVQQVKNSARIVLHVGNGPSRPLPLEVSERLVLGVVTNEEAAQPDVDLNRFAAVQHGVQRRHAAFMYDQHVLYVEDLNTESGTRINGLRLMPGKRYRLRNHDELELGDLRMSLRFLPR